jgi:hypothetical protein
LIKLIRKQRYFSKSTIHEREREREREGEGEKWSSQTNVLMSGSPVAKPKSGSDYSVFIMK